VTVFDELADEGHEEAEAVGVLSVFVDEFAVVVGDVVQTEEQGVVLGDYR
jgi:hypothetical protein